MLVRLLLATVAFVAVSQLAGSVFVALLAAVAAYLLARRRWGTPAVPEVPLGAREPQRPENTGIEVRCEVATPAVQRWVSPKTGRAFEVRPERGIPEAREGDLGRVVIHGGSVSVEPAAAGPVEAGLGDGQPRDS